jgi:hypothetical protein
MMQKQNEIHQSFIFFKLNRTELIILYMLKMVDQDEPAPIKKPRSEAQIASLDKARKKAGELRAQRNVIRENNGISDETDETPTETTTDQTENGSETESTSEDDVREPGVVEIKAKSVKDLHL